MSRQANRPTNRQSFETKMEARRASLEALVYRKTPVAIILVNLFLLALAISPAMDPMEPLFILLFFPALVVDALVSIVGFASCVLLWNLPQTTKKKGILISAALNLSPCLIPLGFAFCFGGF